MGCTQAPESPEQADKLSNQIGSLDAFAKEQEKLLSTGNPNQQSKSVMNKEKSINPVKNTGQTVSKLHTEKSLSTGDTNQQSKLVTDKEKSINPPKKTKKIVRKSYIFIMYHILYGFCVSLILFFQNSKTSTTVRLPINKFSYSNGLRICFPYTLAL